MRVCFFARVPEKTLALRVSALERHEFYGQDIDILRDLGFEVVVATRWHEIPYNVDLYFAWWWAWGILPIVKSLLRRRPCIITGTFDYRLPDGQKDFVHRPAWQRWLMRFTLKNAKANVFVSEFEHTEVPRLLKVANPFYIPLSVPTEIFRPGTQPRDDFTLTMGWMNQGNAIRKCFPEVIRAIPHIRQRHPEMRFVIAGEKGSDFPGLDSLVRRLGLTEYVHFPGIVSREKKIELMQRCKVFLAPSRHEGFGLAILEAMSCGTPVVSSAVGSVPEVVGDAGLLVDGTSPEAIAGAVNRLLADEVLRNEMGRRARERAQTLFPYSRRKNELQRVILNVLGRDGISGFRPAMHPSGPAADSGQDPPRQARG